MRLYKILFLSFALLLSVIPIAAQDELSAVTLTQTETSWTSTDYELDETGAIIPSSVDIFGTRDYTFDAYVLENEYLRVTLVPEYGGRILSIIYKPTGREQLYQNPLGLPYGIGDGNFYYDWLMVYGGIFPTFPGPEHGKTWFLPWDFEVITETDDMISVSMSFVDDITFDAAPSRFNSQPTGLEVEFIVTLEADRKAVDTEVIITNPTDETVRYEYWTCVTLAPGSEIGDTRTPASTEIIAPVDEIKMPPWWPDTIAQEETTGIPNIYTYDNLRTFENWADMGIAYAFPTVENANFWGVINQDNREGLIRVGDNDITQGLKIWTWGFESADVALDQYMFDERRPYIELWAGITPEFFTSTFIRAGEEVSFDEHYIPSVEMGDVTHASTDYLVNFTLNDTGEIMLEVFAVDSTTSGNIIITQGDDILSETALTPEAREAQIISVEASTLDDMSFSIVDDNGEVLLSGVLND